MIEMVVVLFTSFSDVKPIIENRCAQCHNENWPDKNWTDEKTFIKNKDKVIFRLENKTMPPANITELTDEERAKLIDWLKKQ